MSTEALEMLLWELRIDGRFAWGVERRGRLRTSL